MANCIVISDSTSNDNSDFETGKPCVRKRTTRRVKRTSSDKVEVINISDDDFEPGKVYRQPGSQNLRRSPGLGGMCSLASQPSPSCLKGKQADGQRKTWCVKRAERVFANTLPIEISSGDDSDSLPDLQSLTTEDDSNDSMLEGRRDRHFLDVITPGRIRNRKDRISAEKQAGSGPTEPENIPVLRFPELPSILSKRAHWSSSTSSGPKKKLYRNHCTDPETCSTGSDCEVDRKKLKNSRVKFLRGHIPVPTEQIKNVRDFSLLQMMMLEAAQDDNSFDPFMFSHFLNLLMDFSTTQKPPSDIIREVIRIGLYCQESADIACHTYRLVLVLWQKYTDLVEVDWLQLATSADVLKRNLEAHMTGRVTRREGDPGVVQAHLYFNLCVHGLRQNLSQCVLADVKSVRSTLAAANFSTENFLRITQIVDWISCCLVALEQTHSMRDGGDRSKQRMYKMEELVPWLWNLQELLGMSILVSRDRVEAAKRVADKVYHTYRFLPGLKEKRRLLQTTQCPLLCFYVIRHILENCCQGTLLSSAFPSNVHDFVNLYFFALPPKGPVMSLTPPPSPSDEEEAAVNGHDNIHSVESCEELTMLIYYITKSYITCQQRRLVQDLRQQVLKGLESMKHDEMKELRLAVQRFEGHIHDLTAELSPTTVVYLNLLEALYNAS